LLLDTIGNDDRQSFFGVTLCFVDDAVPVGVHFADVGIKLAHSFIIRGDIMSGE
jgi:hypothetical protein